MEKTPRMETKTQEVRRRRPFLLLLLLLLLFLGSPGGAQAGELCRSWLFGISRGGFAANLTRGRPAGWGPFRCPRATEPPGYRFCCGTCLQPYCCPWAENRLDQVACLDSAELKRLTFQELAALPTLRHGETTSTPPGQAAAAATSPPGQLAQPNPAYISYGMPILVFIFFITSFTGVAWIIFQRLRRLENAVQPVQSSEPPDADAPPSTSVAAEALYVPNPTVENVPTPTVDPEASSPDVEGLQESCEMAPCLDNIMSGHSTHPPHKILKNKAVIIPLASLQANVDGLILDPTMVEEETTL